MIRKFLGLKIPFKNSISIDKNQMNLNTNSNIQSIKEAGKALKEKREKLGISINKLAIETKISPTVLEALEEGWLDKLPERTYLNSMISLLERHLGLTVGSLNSIINSQKNMKFDSHRKFLTPSSLEIFQTFPGSLIYFFVMLVTILLLNNYYRRLAVSKTKTIAPINLSLSTSANKSDRIINSKSPKESFRDNWIRSNFKLLFAERGKGWLEINIRRASEIRLRDSYGEKAYLTIKNGRFKLKVKAPITLTIRPPLQKSDKLVWKGKEYFPKRIDKDIYLIEDISNKPEAPAKSLPQRLPLEQ